MHQLITATRAGLESLRQRGLVDPQCLDIHFEGPNVRWNWFKFVALPGHPAPGNASRGYLPANAAPGSEKRLPARRPGAYTHPVELACFRQSQGTVVNPFVGLSQKEIVAAMCELSTALFAEEITEVEIARIVGSGLAGVAAYELPEGKLIRHGDSDADKFPLTSVTLLRHGRTCWQEYPRQGTVDLQPDFEGKLGFVVDEDERERLDDETV